jgi:putative flavoprotein involved in K+ transport
MSLPEATKRTERYNTIVVGAGQAGLSVGYELQKRDDDFLILDGAARVGESWSRRWDSLRLFTSARHSSLPGMEFPASPLHFPSKDDVAAYMERYASTFDLPIRLNTRVSSLTAFGGRYVLETGEVRYEAANVVVATGPFQSPRTPGFAAELSPEIHQLHSSEYVNPHFLRHGPALVVGAGNSGAQIAMELGRFRKAWLAGRPTGQMPRSVLGRDLYDWAWPVLSRLTTDSAAGRMVRDRFRRGDPLIGISKRRLAMSGVASIGRVTGTERGFPVSDGSVIPATVVIWATGFRPNFDWIKLPVFNEDGSPQHHHGVVSKAPGLYFVGLRFQRAYTSALIGGVGQDAARIAAHLTEQST